MSNLHRLGIYRWKMLRLIACVILVLFLTACGGVHPPDGKLIKKAIAVQLQQTQELLNQKLDLDFQGFEIKALSLKAEDAMWFNKLPTFHVKGKYNLVFKLPDQKISQPQKDFDLYLQIQSEAKTWRLLLPDNSDKANPVWRSYKL